jgi:excisionase family DNA binding protein
VDQDGREWAGWRTADEVAQYLGVGVKMARNWVRDGVIRSRFHPRRRVRLVSPADLAIFMERSKVEPRSPGYQVPDLGARGLPPGPGPVGR